MSGPPLARGTVRQASGGVYRVALDRGDVVEASIRGRLKQAARTGGKLVIGDRVEVSEGAEDAATIETVLPRRTEILRKGPGGRRAKIVAANVDRVIVVVSAVDPPPKHQLIDRLLVVAESAGALPVLVVNKQDLPGAREASAPIADLYRRIGYPVLETSADTGVGMEELRATLREGISALVGPSGVGKSSLLNALEPSLDLRTGELSRRTGSGRHTTVGGRLIALAGGGQVADTPGFSDVGVWGVSPEGLSEHFPEMREPARACRFRTCTHTHEPECGVLEALEAGRIARSRYESYVRLLEEAA